MGLNSNLQRPTGGAREGKPARPSPAGSDTVIFRLAEDDLFRDPFADFVPSGR